MDTEMIVARYVGIWNERDAVARRRTIEELWAPDGRHCMGPFDVTGYDALERRISASNARNIVENGCRFSPIGANQELPGLVMFRWEMREVDDSLGSSGIGVLILDENRQIARDYLFPDDD